MKPYAELIKEEEVRRLKVRVKKWAKKHNANKNHAKATLKLVKAMNAAFNYGVMLAEVEKWLEDT